MAEHPDKIKNGSPDQHLQEEVERKAERRLRARREEARSAWFWLGMFGLVGWSIAIPTIIGVALGVWIDRRWPGPVSWALTLLIVGVAIGCLNAWYWIKQESRRD
jgi:ATP synthase protein I